MAFRDALHERWNRIRGGVPHTAEEIPGRRGVPWVPGAAGEIVFCGPLPPAPTGIATYDRAVLDGLERIGFLREHRVDVLWPVEPRDASRFPGYRLGVFQLGNNVEFHLDVYRSVYLTSALIVLHDLALDDFVRGLKSLGDPLGYMAAREAMALRRNLSSADVVRNEPLREPWCAHVARRARGIIVHSDFCKAYLEEFGCRTPVFVVPHPVVETPEAMAAAARLAPSLRAPLEARGMRLLVVAPGDLNEAKRLDAVVAAAAQLPDDVHVALVGRTIPGYDAASVIEAARMGDRVSLLPDVSDEDFRGWLAAADVVVDLRFPHRGEVSGSLARAMQAGKPTVVSATGTYLDVPADRVMLVAPGPTDPGELAIRLRTLIEDDGLRARMGAAAAAHMEALRSSEATAHGYAEAIGATLALVRDPARKALALWGRSLADVGVDEAMLAEGYGLEYARSMESFKRSS
jgi:glycosyltransferase involved in cell wall biosynthesis